MTLVKIVQETEERSYYIAMAVGGLLTAREQNSVKQKKSYENTNMRSSK
jgi:hypothetical protein